MKRFYGKFWGIVVANVDPMARGRIKVRAPDVLGELESAWAEPCLSVSEFALNSVAVPQINTPVWIEFERGSVDRPIWVGCMAKL